MKKALDQTSPGLVLAGRSGMPMLITPSEHLGLFGFGVIIDMIITAVAVIAALSNNMEWEASIIHTVSTLREWNALISASLLDDTTLHTSLANGCKPGIWLLIQNHRPVGLVSASAATTGTATAGRPLRRKWLRVLCGWHCS